MSGYCKTNKDCHCSAPHFSNQGSTCQLACSPDDKANPCCRDDADCQKDGDKDGYCRSLKGFNPGNGMCRCGTGYSGTTSCKKSSAVLLGEPVKAQGLCNPCIQFAEQWLNILLNEILNAGVIGGCGKLCGGLKTKAPRLACNVVCDVVVSRHSSRHSTAQTSTRFTSARNSTRVPRATRMPRPRSSVWMFRLQVGRAVPSL